VFRFIPVLFAATIIAVAPVRAQQAADVPEQCPDTMAAYAGSEEALRCLCPAALAARGAAIWGSTTYTADSATCTAAVHAGVISRRGGVVSLRMLPGQPRYPGTTRNGVSSNNFGAYDASFRFEQPSDAPAPQGAAQQAQADAPAQCPDTMLAYANSDETLHCACDANQVARGGAVWGTDTYTADSATCAAALHAGVLRRQGGEIMLRMLPGQPRYPGTTRNGVTTNNFGAYDSSFRFEGPGRAQAALPAGTGEPTLCPDTMTAYANSDERLRCICPGEATLRGAVWGSDTYTADSATCRAALHAGAIAMGGGIVSLAMLPGQPRYPGTTRNAVTTSNYGPYEASFRFDITQRPVASAPVVQAPIADSLQRTGQVQLYVTFRTGSAELDIAAAPVLTQVRDAMLADPGLRLRLIGHTDNQGGPATNLPLSQRRADAVRLWLAQNGIAPDRLATEGRGQAEPIADNGSEGGRALNRRVQAQRVP
jgi:outer membrane protein OmpA-like peptidoglycan-associated protein